MKLSGAEIIIKLLEKENVKYISGIPGGFILPIYDSLYNSKITHILARHEQGAGFIAQGISRTSDSVGVCFATSGPGATNLLTAIADAKLDSIPLVGITGQVPMNAIGTDAFQEVDAFGLCMPICKHNYLVKDIHDLFTVIPEAFKIASSGRPGPVLIDIPKNIQSETIEIDEFSEIDNSKKDAELIDKDSLNQIAELINKSNKPIIYAGGGITNSKASSELIKFAHKNNIPVTTTLMALGTIPNNDELFIGMLGMHAAPYTNYLIEEADLIIAIGVRFDDRATGAVNSFCKNASIIHIDIDPSEINKLKPSNLSLIADSKEFLREITPLIEENSREYWISNCKNLKEKYPLPKYDGLLHPANIIPFIASKVSQETIVTTDVGEHQMWTAQRYPFMLPKKLITSGGLGTMGFGLPAAIGAALVNKDKEVICFSGDGSILMNIQELATLADYNLNVKVIVFNNGHLGLVRQQQELFYNNHIMASKFISNPDFKKIGEGFGIKGCDLGEEENPLEKLTEILNSKDPYIINVPMDSTSKVYPMVAPGASNLNMIGEEYCNK